MSLNQFLAVGRSFVGLREAKSPFEMKKECLLPIFDGQPRFRATERAESKHESEGAAEGPAMAAHDFSGAARAKTDKAEIERVREAGSLSARMPQPAAERELPKKRSLWSFLSFGWFWRRKPPEKALVQAELKLEKVQVLRNDLSDADLEVVKRKRPQARKALAAARPFATVEEQQPWSKLASRLFEESRR